MLWKIKFIKTSDPIRHLTMICRRNLYAGLQVAGVSSDHGGTLLIFSFFNLPGHLIHDPHFSSGDEASLSCINQKKMKKMGNDN